MRSITDEVVELIGMTPTSIRGGDLSFHRRGLHSVLSIWKDRYDKSRTGCFSWWVITYDEVLQSQLRGLAGMGIRIDHPRLSDDATFSNSAQAASYPWPERGYPLDAEASTAFAEFAHLSLRFVRDRRDLGRLLLADVPIHRGSVWSVASTISEPARLAQALLLARHAGDQDLEQSALSKLQQKGEELVDPWPNVLFREAVADFAEAYSKATGVYMGDVFKPKGRDTCS
ncbi:hypothetical protein [Streptomyces sp. NPDC053431]|uniref:hypothetical protein n=1 Tax=Streptomyces sp. NPDC053431 TaxID=3365703 RepID=UPI0037D34D67